MNPFLPPPPCADEPLPLTPSQRCRTLPFFHTAPPNPSYKHLLMDSTSQHHHRGASTTPAATHSIVSGLSKTRTLAYPVTPKPTPKRSTKLSRSLPRSHSLALCTSHLWRGTVPPTTSRVVNGSS
ncbi:uncharacterized protein DS421_7g208020 [Arachis hypogaea]|nr:uncharacterized protein DS421_7g208020 [Arachis hypogaea]